VLFNKKRKLAIVLLFSTFAASCAGTLTGIKEENRDTTGAYDGTWKVDVQKSAGLQYQGNWRMQCGDMQRTFYVRVDDGAMTDRKGADAEKGYISSDGVFKLIQPLSSKASATGSSSTTMANGDMKLILTGKLVPGSENSKGHITYGIAEFGYGGCTAKTKYTLTNPAT